MTNRIKLADIVSGPKAFYNQPTYINQTKKDFARSKALPTMATYNTQCTVARIALEIFYTICFPVGLYRLAHALVGRATLILPIDQNNLDQARKGLDLSTKWKYKRMTVSVNGRKIDTMIIGKPSTLGNGRWVLITEGMGGCYEYNLQGSGFKNLLKSCQANALLFNYTGIGSSKGLPYRNQLVNSTSALMHLLEDKSYGIGAKEIIGFGNSLGGGIQARAIQQHKFRKNVKYLFIKHRTFNTLKKAVSRVKNKTLGNLVALIGWNFDCTASSKQLRHPEIVIQTANTTVNRDLTNSSLIRNDGIIRLDISLAKDILDDPTCPKHNKVIVGVPEDHGTPVRDTIYLANKVNALLA